MPDKVRDPRRKEFDPSEIGIEISPESLGLKGPGGSVSGPFLESMNPIEEGVTIPGVIRSMREQAPVALGAIGAVAAPELLPFEAGAALPWMARAAIKSAPRIIGATSGGYAGGMLNDPSSAPSEALKQGELEAGGMLLGAPISAAARGIARPLMRTALSRGTGEDVENALNLTPLNPSMFRRMASSALGVEPSGISTTPEGRAQLQSLIAPQADKVRSIIASRPETTISPKAVTAPLEDIAQGYEKGSMSDPAASEIRRFASKFEEKNPGPILASRAQEMKQADYKINRPLYEKDLNLSQVEKVARKNLTSSLKTEIEKIFPEVKHLNEAQARELGLDQAIEESLENYKAPIAAPIAHGAVGVSEGFTKYGQAGVIGHVLKNPKVASKLAIAMNLFGKKTSAIPSLSNIGRASGVSDEDLKLPSLTSPEQ